MHVLFYNLFFFYYSMVDKGSILFSNDVYKTNYYHILHIIIHIPFSAFLPLTNCWRFPNFLNKLPSFLPFTTVMDLVRNLQGTAIASDSVSLSWTLPSYSNIIIYGCIVYYASIPGKVVCETSLRFLLVLRKDLQKQTATNF